MILHNCLISKLIGYHITLFPFICLGDTKENLIKSRGQCEYDCLVNHERIHLRQQLECLVIPFYLIYFLNWIINIFKYGKKAYVNISFERESYENDNNLKYLPSRKLYTWIKYLTKK